VDPARRYGRWLCYCVGSAKRVNPVAPKGRVAMSKSPSMMAPPLFRVRAILFTGRFGNQVFDSPERVRVTAAPLCSGAGPEAWRGAVALEEGGIACDAGAPAGADYTLACWPGSTAGGFSDSSWGLNERGLLRAAHAADPRRRARQDQVPALRPARCSRALRWTI
jgi:hypothetical protein